jgi:hypothetical protein
MMGHGTSTRSKRASGTLGAAAAITAALLTLASCSPSPPHPAKAPSPGSKGHPAGTGAGQLGSTLAVSDSSGTQLEVTLQKVIDPASGASQYSKAASGKHFVGIKLQIKNKASATYQNNANNETTITLSGGKTLHANYNPIANCGNFDNGQITLKSGAASTGCVTFQVPNGQKVIQVGYRNTVFPGKNADWQIS